MARDATPHSPAMRGDHARRVDLVRRRRAPSSWSSAARWLEHADDADVISLRTPIDAESRRVLFRVAAAVLANSGHEPFGLVGLETMAVGGLACTGCSGEDYAIPGRNALVLQTASAEEFVRLFTRMREHADDESSLRRAGRRTAEQFAWPKVVTRNLLPAIAIGGG